MRTKLLVLVVASLLAVFALTSCSGTTDPASNVTATTATLNAHVKCDGGNQNSYSGTPGEPCSFYFRLRKVGASVWTGTPRQPNADPAQGVNSTTPSLSAHADVTNLDPSTQYEYEVCGRGDATHTDTCPSAGGTATTKFTTQAPSNDDPSGQAMPASAPTGWTRVGDENFPSPTFTTGFPASFTQYPAGWQDTSKQGTYGCAGGVARSGGVLSFSLSASSVCAPVFKDQGGTGTDQFGIPNGMTEGRYSVRFRVRSGASSNHKIAWLLWPDNNAGAGEIDFPEVTNFPDVAEAFTHPTSGSQQSFSSGVTLGTDNAWHTATIERKSASVRYLMDGNVLGTSTSSLPQQAMHWVLQSETRVDATSPPTSGQTDIDLDWVTVDKPTSTPPPPKKCADGLDNDGDGKIDLADPGCSGSTDDDETDPVVGGGTITAAAVGDVCEDSSCTNGGKTAATISGISPDIVLGLGDFQYHDDGSGGSTFSAGFATKFASLISQIAPVFGNTHDTESGSGTPSGFILNYFDQNGNPLVRGKIVSGYTTGSKWGYAFNLSNGWRVYALNYTAGSGQLSALQADIAAHPTSCILALDHAPVIGSTTGTHPSNEGAFYQQTLVNAGVDLVLAGHNHMYERTVSGGLTQILDGEGGVGHYARNSTASGSQAYDSSSYGPIKLTLTSTSWSSQFIPNAGASAFSDTAQGTC